MGKGDLKLTRLAFFEIKKEKDDNVVTDIIGNTVLNLQKPKPEHLHLVSVLERNIKKRIMSLESKDASKKLTKNSAIEWFEDLESRGPPSKAIVLPLSDEQQKKKLQEVLDATEDPDFRRACAGLNSSFVKLTKRPKGVIGYVQFDFQITGNIPKRFLSILITDFSPDTLTLDTLSVLKYLEKTFNHDFRTTIIYPHIIKEESSDKKGIKPTIFLNTDKNNVKIHTRTDDPAVFSIVGAQPPRDPQKEIEKLYKVKSSDLTDISEIEKFVTKKDMKSVTVSIRISDTEKLFVDLDTFINKYELFISKSGKGMLIKGADIEVFLGDRNLLDEQMIKFKSLEELFIDDNRK